MERIPGYAALYYWFGMLLIRQAKRMKYEAAAEKRDLDVRDFFWFFIVAVVAGAGLSLEHVWLNRALFVITATLFLGLWLDAIVMNQFSIQINSHALRIYAANASLMNREAAWAWRNVARKPLLALFPVACLTFYFLFIFQYDWTLRLAIPLLAAYCLGGATFSKRQLFSFLGASVAALAITGVMQVGVSREPGEFVQGAIPYWVAGVTSGLLVALLLFDRTGAPGSLKPRFLERPGFSSVDRAKHRRGTETELSAMIPIPMQYQQRSDCYHQFNGSNIVLVTLESISASKVATLSGEGASMPVFESLKGRGLSSRRHFCISPNTNNALVAIYNGNYYNQCTFPHLPALHAQGYKSVAIVPQDSAGFGFGELLHEIGFQHVIDLNSFPEDFVVVKNALRETMVYYVKDELFYERTFARLTKILQPNEKVFLHIMNSQTHVPYTTYCGTPPADSLARYIQALEEADRALDRFLHQLDELIPLPETLLVYTADHGESLGEHGYKAHSTAVTREQINVPFAIGIPGIPHFKADFSTHFDVFPTLFDFLGIQYDYPAIGAPLLAKNRGLNAVLYSETRHGRTPSCFGHVGASGKILFDVALDRCWLTDLDDQEIEPIFGSERERYRTALLQALDSRGLVYD